MCTECDGRLRSAETETVCTECGLVLAADAVERGPERGPGGDEPDGRGTGAPLSVSRHDGGLSTEIGYGSGTEVSGSRQRLLVRMRRQHDRARLDSTAARNERYAYAEIRRLVSAMALSDPIGDQSCSLFASAQSEDLLAGRSLEGFAAAVVYATCRTQSVARTMGEILDVARADRSELKTAYDALNRELGLPVGPVSPREYLPRYASELDVGAAVERRAHEYATRLEESGLTNGKKPSGVAAASLYRAADELDSSITQGEAAEAAGVARVTILSRLDDLESLA